MYQLLALTTDSIARQARREKPPTDLDLAVMRHTVKEFLDALQNALARPPGNLPRRADPVQHAGFSATSWHDLALLAGVRVFGAMLMRLDHRTYFTAIERFVPDREKFTGHELSMEQIVAEWPVVCGDVADAIGPQFDGKVVAAEIKVEADAVAELSKPAAEEIKKPSRRAAGVLSGTMLSAIMADPNSRCETSRQWAARLKATASQVVDLPAWKQLEEFREIQKIERQRKKRQGRRAK